MQQQHQQQGRGYPHAPYPINQQSSSSSYSASAPPPEIEIYRRRVEELEAEKTRLSQLNMDMNNELFDLKACSAASATEAKVEARKEIEKVQSESKMRERDLERLTKENQTLLRQLSTFKQQPTSSSSSASLSNGINGGLHGMNGTNSGSNSGLRLSGGGAGDSRNEGRLSARSNDSNGVRSASPRNATNSANGNGNSSERSTGSRHDSVNDGGGGSNGAAATAATTMSLRDEDSLTALQSVMHTAPGQGLAVTTQSAASASSTVTAVAAGTGTATSGGGIIDRSSGSSSGSAAAVSNTSLPALPLAAGAAVSTTVSVINHRQLPSLNSHPPTSSTTSSTKWSSSKGYCVPSGSLIAALLPLYQRLLIRPLSLSTRTHTHITQALDTLQGAFNGMVVEMAHVTGMVGLGGFEPATHCHPGIYGSGSVGEGNRRSESSSSSSSSSVNVRDGSDVTSGGGVVGRGASRARDVALVVSLQLIALTGSVVALTQAVVDQQQDPYPPHHPQSHHYSHSRDEQRGRGDPPYHEKNSASPSPHDGDDDDGDDEEDPPRDVPTPLSDEHLQYLHDCLVLTHAVTGYLDIEAVHLLIAARLVSEGR